MSLVKKFLGFLSIILLFIFGCESVRVKHSEFVKSWQVPDDSEADWPSPDQVYFDLRENIQGDVFLPGHWNYRHRSVVRNWRFRSKPRAVVYPESTSDAQKAILFAGDYGIRPTVFSTGHEMLGRSARDHTLSINMRRMKQMEVNLNDSRSDTNMTITVGTGRSWGEIYKEEYNPGVSPGGYIPGGGHSAITRMKGLGADQVVAFTLVTANGSIVYMTEEGGIMESPDGTTEPVTDPDLWWAVLGGGGGVYGVVTQFLLKLHPAPDGFIRLALQWKIVTDGKCAGVATEVFRLGTLKFSLVHWGRNEDEAMSALQEFVNFRMDCQVLNTVEVFNTFWEYSRQVEDSTWSGIRQHWISTTLQEEDCVPGSGAAAMMIDILNVTELTHFFPACFSVLIGGKANNLPHEANSVSPDFRNGLVCLVCESAWVSEKDDEAVISALLHHANNRMYQHGTGAYYSESDYYLQNWQVEYWGSIERYQRLLDVKQRWDPDNMFWCHHCVGSEFV